VLPHWMQWVSLALPPSYVFEGMRASYVFEGMRALLADRPFPPPGSLLLQGSLVAVFELLLAAYFYGRVYRHAVRTVLLARYSAESMA
jgi:ABC-2 type transport system permease protein